jgi:hypothetical protein
MQTGAASKKMEIPRSGLSAIGLLNHREANGRFDIDQICLSEWPLW